MTGGTTRDGDAPRAIFSAAARMRRWLPLYVVDIALLLIATVLLIASIFTVYATPTVSLFTSGIVSIAGTVAEVFPNDTSAQFIAANSACQTLLNVGCPLIFPNTATASTMATDIVKSWFGLEGVDDSVMLDQASPYDFVSCDWAPSITPGQQVDDWHQFTTPILDVQMRSTTLPEMVTVSAQIGCATTIAPGRHITTYRIENRTLLSLVSDPDGLDNGTTIAAPELADLAREGTEDRSLLRTVAYSTSPPCVDWFKDDDYYNGFGCGSAPGVYVVYNDSIRRCPSSTPVEDSVVTVCVCEAVKLDAHYLDETPGTVATTVKMDYRYRASGSDMQLVQLDSPSSTRSTTTGEATAPHSRGGLTRAVGITIAAVVVLGITLVIVVVATVCVACNHKRAKSTVTTMQDGFASPWGNPLGRLVEPRDELLQHVADTKDAPDDPLFEYEPPQDERDATLAAEDRPYGQGAYYGPGEKPPAEAEPHKTRETAAALESSRGDHTPYGSANEKMWSAEEERSVVDGAAVKAISTAPESTPDADSHGNVGGAAAPFTEETTEHGRRAPGSAVAESAELPNGIPLRMDGNAGLYERVGFSAVRRHANHTRGMFLLLVPACVLSTVGALLSLVILVVQITGALEHWKGVVSQYGIASASASVVMHPEGGAIALYVIALVAALAAAIMVWCLLICRIY